MAPQNDFLAFCPTDTGSNLLTESDYLGSADRVSGNKPGIASAKLNNKALRQAAYISSQLAQLVANTLGQDILDDATPAKLLAQFVATLQPFAANVTVKLSGSGSFNLTYIFMIASGSATTGATYTNNAVTFTVVATVASGTLIRMTGAGDPALAGTLTKASGTGDATLTFYAFRKPLSIDVFAVAGGGGGQGSGSTSPAGSNGGNTTFGTTLIVAGGGGGGGTGSGGGGGAGGTAALGSGPVGLVAIGSVGGSPQILGANTTLAGGASGGASSLGGAGNGGVYSSDGTAGAANTGGGGGGGGVTGSGSNPQTGSGGGAGGTVIGRISSPLSVYSWAVGAPGAAGAAGTSGFAGGLGGGGVLRLTENY